MRLSKKLVLLMLVACLGCVSIKADSGQLKSIKTGGTASVELEVDDQMNVKKVTTSTDGKNAVPIFGGIMDALGRILGSGGGDTTINVNGAEEEPTS